MLRTANGVPGAWGDRIKILTSSPSSSSNETMEHREKKETYVLQRGRRGRRRRNRSIDRQLFLSKSLQRVVHDDRSLSLHGKKEKEEEGEEEEEGVGVGVGGREGMEKDGVKQFSENSFKELSLRRLTIDKWIDRYDANGV
ncbi:hypothetical protein V1477_020012, partial [Vespula maculifrons]